MSNLYSKTPNRQPNPDGDRVEQLLEGIGKLSVKVVHRSEQSWLTAGLLFVLVNVYIRLYAVAMKPGRPAQTFLN